MSHYRNTWKPARLFMVDARVAFLFILAFLHIRLWTLGLACGAALILYILERRGLTVTAAGRALRATLVGDHRPAKRPQKIRHKADYEIMRYR